jgi:hypothetical protein
VAAHAATMPILSQEQWKNCEDNNPWVKSGYCERTNAWNKAKCLCPGENFGGGPGPWVAEVTDETCGDYGRDTKFLKKIDKKIKNPEYRTTNFNFSPKSFVQPHFNFFH